jgi:osmotically-inducible protein OsmY
MVLGADVEFSTHCAKFHTASIHHVDPRMRGQFKTTANYSTNGMAREPEHPIAWSFRGDDSRAIPEYLTAPTRRFTPARALQWLKQPYVVSPCRRHIAPGDETTHAAEEYAMSLAHLVETDVRLRDTVIRHLDWDPEVDASSLGTSATDGIVTLTGFIDTYAGKLAAERAVKRIRGVRAVANDIVVRLKVPRTDQDIARDVAQALANPQALADTVQATVHQGHITLTGKVQWLFERELAERLVHHVRGVIGVHNHITVAPRSATRDIRRRIVHALHQQADIDARHIEVTLNDHTVTLTGTIENWAEREAVEQAASRAPGVTQVDNHLTVTSVFVPEPVDEIC